MMEMPPVPTATQRALAYAVHVYTAAGGALALLAAMEICNPVPSARRVFALLFAAVLVDATDGPLARRWHVKHWAARIDGRTIDDLVDYLTYTFIPLLLMWRLDWLPQPAEIFIIPALIASLFGFANREAKDEAGGFFLGFPSYWNVVAFYGGLNAGPVGIWVNAALVLILATMTVMPVRFLYPNLAPRPWKVPLLAGALAWLAMLGAMLATYPRAPLWLVWTSLAYPVFYTGLSVILSRARRLRTVF